jgi:hypothetical protein
VGSINITAGGSMTPDERQRDGYFPHGGTYAECVNAARKFLDDLEHDLRTKLGSEVYDTQ